MDDDELNWRNDQVRTEPWPTDAVTVVKEARLIDPIVRAIEATHVIVERAPLADSAVPLGDFEPEPLGQSTLRVAVARAVAAGIVQGMRVQLDEMRLGTSVVVDYVLHEILGEENEEDAREMRLRLDLDLPLRDAIIAHDWGLPSGEPWPERADQMGDFEEIVDPLTAQLSAACELERNEAPITYSGLQLGRSFASTMPVKLSERLSPAWIEYESEAGRDLVDIHVAHAFLLGVEQGRRQLRADLVAQLPQLIAQPLSAAEPSIDTQQLATFAKELGAYVSQHGFDHTDDLSKKLRLRIDASQARLRDKPLSEETKAVMREIWNSLD